MSRRVQQRTPARPEVSCQVRVDIFEMHMYDPVAVAARELHRIGPTDRQVTRVQAPPDIDDRHRAFDLLGALDQRAGVRVHGHGQPVLPRKGLDLIQVLGHSRPAAIVELLRRAPLHVLNDADHEHPATRLRDQLGRLACLADRAVELGLVHYERDEPPDELEPVALQFCRDTLGIVGEEPDRAELRSAQPELGHLRQRPVERRHHAPSRDLTGTPGDWCAGQAVIERRRRTGALLVRLLHSSAVLSLRAALDRSNPVTRLERSNSGSRLYPVAFEEVKLLRTEMSPRWAFV